MPDGLMLYFPWKFSLEQKYRHSLHDVHYRKSLQQVLPGEKANILSKFGQILAFFTWLQPSSSVVSVNDNETASVKEWHRVSSKSPWLVRAVEAVMSKEMDETWFKIFVKTCRPCFWMHDFRIFGFFFLSEINSCLYDTQLMYLDIITEM